MTKVLHLLTRFKRGGAERTTKNTLQSLQKSDESYELYLGFGNEYAEEERELIERQGIETVEFGFLRHYNPVTAPFAVLQVALFLLRNNIDILHTHNTEAGIIGRLAGWLAGVPLIIHEIHGDPITKDRSYLLNSFVLVMERLVAPLTTTLVAKSEQIKETYLQRDIGTNEQYVVIYHGVDISRFEDVEAVSKEPDGGFTALFVGRLVKGKGLFDLFDAFEALENEFDIRLEIVGDGQLREQLKCDANNRGISVNVDILGYREDIPQLMANADVLVLPSYREGTPRVITEALSAGLPVVATDIAGIPEQVTEGKSGILIEPGNIDELATALRRLVESPKFRNALEKNTRSEIDPFRKETVQRQFVSLYSSLVERHLD